MATARGPGQLAGVESGRAVGLASHQGVGWGTAATQGGAGAEKCPHSRAVSLSEERVVTLQISH